MNLRELGLPMLFISLPKALLFEIFGWKCGLLMQPSTCHPRSLAPDPCKWMLPQCSRNDSDKSSELPCIQLQTAHDEPPARQKFEKWPGLHSPSAQGIQKKNALLVFLQSLLFYTEFRVN